ncbi:MAG: acetyl-CoA hydrolase [Firmicutes bacterium]|nr:acetyl-CoA hydrolase [Bacillota bacterium]
MSNYSHLISDDIMQREYLDRIMSADQAVQMVKDGDRVYIGTASSMPDELNEALARRKDQLQDITVMCSNPKLPSAAIECGAFNTHSYFIGDQERRHYGEKTFDFSPIHLSQVDIWCQHIGRPSVAFFEVSPPDENGYMSYGASGVILHEYVKKKADRIILQVNCHAPYVYGENNLIHCTEANAIVEFDHEIGIIPDVGVDDTMQKICSYVLDHIKDGSTIQLGIGRVATAMGYLLKSKNDLGLHTEVIGDSCMELIKSGNINNSRKTYFPGKSLCGFALGSSQELYRFLDRNENLHFQPFPILNNPYNIAKNDNFISLNSAMSVDLTGQVASEGVGFRQFSGTGGQLDYVKGSQMSKGGKSFILLESTFHSKSTGKSGSHIVSTFDPGTVVTTPRSEVQYVGTEFGCVNLKNLSVKDRVKAMISIAHPDYRDQLYEEAKMYKLL